jgi:hypothetical protein
MSITNTNINITGDVDTDALDDALQGAQNNSNRTRDADPAQGYESLDDLLGALDESVAELDNAVNAESDSGSTEFKADGELTGDESLSELGEELDYAMGELNDALAGDAGGAEESSELTPQDFQKQLSDIAGKSEDWGAAGEEAMLDQGKRLMNATPEQQQAFLDKAKELMDGSGDGDSASDISGREGSELKGFVDGLLNDASQSADDAEGADGESGSFMDKVEDLLGQSGNQAEGEKLAREAAKLLEDNPEEDKQAFLEQLEKVLNNADEDYDKDVDQTNHNEGTILKKMAEAFEELSSDRGESSEGSSGSDSSASDTGAISTMLLDIVTNKGSEGGSEITPAEASTLRAFLDQMEGSEAETA